MNMRPLGAPIRFLGNLSIRSKLFLCGGVLIFLLVALATLIFTQLRAIQTHQLPARAAVREMETALMAMRVSEQQFVNEADTLNPAFYQNNHSETFDEWQSRSQEFQKNFDILSSLYPTGTVAADLHILGPQIAAYHQAFLDLSETYQQRGFDTFGREGEMHRSADSLKARLQNRPAVQAILQQLLQSQEKFFLNEDVTAITAFDQHAAQLKQRLPAKDQVLLTEYGRLFHEVAQMEQKIGLSSDEGLRGALNQQINAALPRVNKLEAYVLGITLNNIKSISRTINVVTIGLIAIVLIMVAVIVRYLNRRLSLLLAASEKVASGDLKSRVPDLNKDELGVLASSFNLMTNQLQQNQKVLRERAYSLHESVRRFELVSRAVNEAVYDWNVKTGDFTWGEGLIKVFGYKAEDKKATIDWWAERIHIDDAEKINRSIDEHIKRHSATWKKEYRFRKASGEYVYCQDRGFIEYAHGQPVRMVGSLVDISRQKALEHAKDEFISIASHQLRTPLGSIRWNLELLLEEAKKLPPEVADNIQEAYNSTLRMGSLVNDLLSVARIEQGRVKEIPETTNVAEIVGLAVQEMQPIAKRGNVKIDTSDLKGRKLELVIDPKRLREVIQNLLSNAVKYTHAKGKVTITAQIKAQKIILSIADTGIGIPTEDHSKMFAKFYRASNVTKTDTEGSGLGLFVVKSYVEGWGGKIWFKSELGKGTTFFVSIPLKAHSSKAKK